MKRFAFPFLVLFVFIQAHSQPSPPPQKILADPSTALGGTSSQLLDSVEFIPLETSKASVFGSIWKMEVMDDYFVIGDMDTKAILVFQKNGKFYSRIDKTVLKGDPGLNFTVDNTNKLIITRLVNAPKTLYWMDLKGHIVKELSLNDILYSEGSLGDSLVLISPWTYSEKPPGSDSIDYAVQYLSNNKIVNRLLPVPVKLFRIQMTTSMPRPNFFYSSGDPDKEVFIGENYDYTVRILNRSGIRQTYQLVFPQDLSLPADFLTNSTYREKEDQYLKENLKKIIALRNVYYTGDHLCFETLNSTFFNKDRYLYCNLKTGNMFSMERITSDSSSYFLPLLGQQEGGGIVGCRGKSLYSAVTSLELFQALEANKARHPNYPLVLQNYFATSTKQSNPVLIKMKFKENM